MAPKAKTIVFGSDDIHNVRKGIYILVRALNSLKKEGVEFTGLVIGEKGEKTYDTLFETIYFNTINDKRFLSLVYSAGDMFVIPSFYEAFGLMSAEAMACGTAVVGFETGGIPDQVIKNQTGLLAKWKNEEDLKTQIKFLMENDDLRHLMGINCRQFIKQNFRAETQVERYRSIYNGLK